MCQCEVSQMIGSWERHLQGKKHQINLQQNVDENSEWQIVDYHRRKRNNRQKKCLLKRLPKPITWNHTTDGKKKDGVAIRPQENDEHEYFCQDTEFDAEAF